MAIFSAYANDEGYENVFCNQLDSLLLPDDVVIAISASGNSPNVIKAVELARTRRATTIAFTGFDGGRLASLVDVNLNVPSNLIEQVEDIHLMMEHLITKVLREEVRQVSTSGELEELFPQSMHRFKTEAEDAPLTLDTANPVTSDRSQKSLDLFTAISRELAVELNLRDLLRRILRITLDNMGATSGSILVIGETGRVLEGALVYNGVYQTHAPQYFAEVLERGLAGWVVENRKAALISNTQDDPRWLRRSWDQQSGNSRSAMSVPLLADDHVCGVLTLVNSKVDAFTEKDLTLLAALSTFVSLVNYAV
jgi:D-sedoheptulose 7-phosphate isomerase